MVAITDGDDERLTAIRAITDAWPAYGTRRVTVLLNRAWRGAGMPPVDGKRVPCASCAGPL